MNEVIIKTNNTYRMFMYGTFIAACCFIAYLFITATSYTQLAIATLLYPPLIYFAFLCFPPGIKNIEIRKPSVTINPSPEVKEEDVKPEKGIEIVDIDKRAFLKLIGAAGFSFMLFSLLANKIETLLFGRSIGTISGLEGPKEETVTIKGQPTDGYKISEIDNGDYTYYGFVNSKGAWYIMREDPETGSFRYTKGEGNYPGGWENRSNLKYDYFQNVFYQQPN